MKTIQQLRLNAENCVELARTAESEPAKKRFQRMAEGWGAVVESQKWLDGTPKESYSKSI